MSSSGISSSVITFYKTSHFIYFIRNRLLLLTLNNYRILIINFIIIVNSAIMAIIDYFMFSYGFERQSFGPCSPTPGYTLFLILTPTHIHEVVSTLEARIARKFCTLKSKILNKCFRVPLFHQGEMNAHQ